MDLNNISSGNDMAKKPEEENGNGNHHEPIERRKKWNFVARFIISGIVFSIFFILIYVLFFQEVQDLIVI
tara:strand:- start:350 stop:559 length:210 start_codon:yes stop_codon:yes gene_type:complete